MVAAFLAGARKTLKRTHCSAVKELARQSRAATACAPLVRAITSEIRKMKGRRRRRLSVCQRAREKGEGWGHVEVREGMICSTREKKETAEPGEWDFYIKLPRS